MKKARYRKLPKWLSGRQGSPGPNGIPGRNGIKYVLIPGDKGATGKRGCPGKKGNIGRAGPPGAPGKVGAPGPEGLPGIAGTTGSQGKVSFSCVKKDQRFSRLSQ